MCFREIIYNRFIFFEIISMRKKSFLILCMIILSISQAFANFSDISHYYLYFKNKNTNEVKYIETKSFGRWFFFNEYLLKYLDWSNIWADSKLDIWKLYKIEEAYYMSKSNSTIYSYSNSWKISVWAFIINYENKLSTWSLSDISKLKLLWFQDITNDEKMSIYSNIFLDFFWILFLVFLPLNIIVFFCFWYLLFLLYERFWIKIFQNAYINSLIVYLIFYLLIIYNWFSFTELSSSDPFWFMAYALVVWVPKFVLYLISYILFESFHKKHHEKKIIYKKVMYWYFLIFCLSIIVSQIINHYN